MTAAGCNGDAGVLRNLPDNANESAVDVSAFRCMGQFMVDQGILSNAPDMNALLAGFARR
jgi:hypothetical protein